MALARRTVSLRVNGSVDERSDSKQTPPDAKMAALADVDLSETGAIKKRRPYTNGLSGAFEGLLTGGLNGTYSPIQEYNPTHGLLAAKNYTPLDDLCVTDRRVLRADSDTSYLRPYAAYSSNGRLYVSFNHDTAAGPTEWRVASLDPDTYEQLNAYDDEAPVAGNSIPVQLLARDDGVVAIYASLPVDMTLRASNDDATSWGSPSSPITGVDWTKPYAVCQKDETTGYVVYTEISSGIRRCYELDLENLTASLIGSDSSGAATALDIAYFPIQDEVRVIQFNSTIGIELWDPHGGTTQAVDAAKTANVSNVAVGLLGSGATAMFAYDYSDPGGTGDELKWLYVGAFDAGTLGIGVTHEAMAQHLESKILDGKFVIKYAPQPSGSTTKQLATAASRYLVRCEVDSGGDLRLRPIAVMSYAEAPRRPVWADSWLPPLLSDGADRLFYPGHNYVNFRLFYGNPGNAGSGTQVDVSLYSFDFAAHRVGYNVAAHGMHVIAGGLPRLYDGVGTTALGLLNAPVIGRVATSNSTGSLTNSATYQWVAVFEFADSQGRRWLSQPSLPVEATLGASDDTADLDVYAAVTVDEAERYVTRVILYRNTVANPTVFYRVTRHVTGSPLTLQAGFNDLSSSVIAITDVFQDSDIEQNETLYALPSGPVLEDYPPPPCHTLAVHKRRLFAVHSETGDVWGSKLFVGGEGIRFTPSMAVTNPFPQERPTALVSTEAALLVFYRSRIGRILGEGPNDLGQGSWSEIEFFPSHTVGAVSQRCTEPTPAGVYFVDERQGPMLLPYGGYPQPIGHDWPIGSYDDSTVRGVDWLEDRDEVRFTFADGTYRALHVKFGSWTTGTITDQGVVQTAVWDQNHVAVLDNHTIALEDAAGLYQTPGLNWSTTWIKLAALPGIQGRYRLWDVYLIGEYVDTHNLTVRISYDYDDSDYYEVSFADAVLSTLNPYQIRVRPNRQQVQAVKISVSEWVPDEGMSPVPGATSQAYKLSQIQLHFGVKPRGGRPWTQQAGMG